MGWRPLHRPRGRHARRRSVGVVGSRLGALVALAAGGLLLVIQQAALAQDPGAGWSPDTDSGVEAEAAPGQESGDEQAPGQESGDEQEPDAGDGGGSSPPGSLGAMKNTEAAGAGLVAEIDREPLPTDVGGVPAADPPASGGSTAPRLDQYYKSERTTVAPVDEASVDPTGDGDEGSAAAGQGGSPGAPLGSVASMPPPTTPPPPAAVAGVARVPFAPGHVGDGLVAGDWTTTTPPTQPPAPLIERLLLGQVTPEQAKDLTGLDQASYALSQYTLGLRKTLDPLLAGNPLSPASAVWHAGSPSTVVAASHWLQQLTNNPDAALAEAWDGYNAWAETEFGATAYEHSDGSFLGWVNVANHAVYPEPVLNAWDGFAAGLGPATTTAGDWLTSTAEDPARPHGELWDAAAGPARAGVGHRPPARPHPPPTRPTDRTPPRRRRTWTPP